MSSAVSSFITFASFSWAISVFSPAAGCCELHSHSTSTGESRGFIHRAFVKQKPEATDYP